MKHLPLTRDDLNTIQTRNVEKAKDVQALLWEIKRLRAVVLVTADAMRNARHSIGQNMLVVALEKLEQGALRDRRSDCARVVSKNSPTT